MEYQKYIDNVRGLGFVKDQDTADAMVKAVLGILASRLKRPQAREMTEQLPEPLNMDLLRSHQKATALAISVKEFTNEMCDQFSIDKDQALQMIGRVLHTAKEDLGGAIETDLEGNLPDEWADLIKKA